MSASLWAEGALLLRLFKLHGSRDRQHHCLIPESLNPHPHYWEFLAGNRGHPVSFNKPSGTRHAKNIVGATLDLIGSPLSPASFEGSLGWNPDFEINILGKGRGNWRFRGPHLPCYHSQRHQTLKYTLSLTPPCRKSYKLHLPKLPRAYLGISPTFPSLERPYHCTVTPNPTQDYPRKAIFLTCPSFIHGS